MIKSRPVLRKLMNQPDTLDQLMRYKAGTEVYSGTSNTATDEVDIITLANINTAIALKANAKKITKQVDASTGYNTYRLLYRFSSPNW